MKKWMIGLLFLVLCFGVYPYANAEMETDGFSNAVTITTAGSSVSHATDCTGLTATTGTICYEVDADVFYVCEPSAGDCDTAGEWKINAYVMKVGDTMTGALIIDDTSIQIQEGVDTLTLTAPTLTAARAVTFGDAAGEIALLSGGMFTGIVNLNDVALTFEEGVDTMTITVPTLTAARAVTFGDAAGEVALLSGGMFTGIVNLNDVALTFEEGVDTMTITVPTLTAARAVTIPDQAGALMLDAGGTFTGVITTVGVAADGDSTHAIGADAVRYTNLFTDSVDVGAVGASAVLTSPAENILSTSAYRATAAQVTVGSGTGLTVDDAGTVRSQVYKVTLTYAGLSAAATTATHTIATLPAGMKLISVVADTTTKYIGGGVATATIQVGIDSGDTDGFTLAHDVFAAAVVQGDTRAEHGTELDGSTAEKDFYIDWAGTTVVSALLTVDTTTDALTQGSTTYYLETVQVK